MLVLLYSRSWPELWLFLSLDTLPSSTSVWPVLPTPTLEIPHSVFFLRVDVFKILPWSSCVGGEFFVFSSSVTSSQSSRLPGSWFVRADLLVVRLETQGLDFLLRGEASKILSRSSCVKGEHSFRLFEFSSSVTSSKSSRLSDSCSFWADLTIAWPKTLFY